MFREIKENLDSNDDLDLIKPFLTVVSFCLNTNSFSFNVKILRLPTWI